MALGTDQDLIPTPRYLKEEYNLIVFAFSCTSCLKPMSRQIMFITHWRYEIVFSLNLMLDDIVE